MVSFRLHMFIINWLQQRLQNAANKRRAAEQSQNIAADREVRDRRIGKIKKYFLRLEMIQHKLPTTTSLGIYYRAETRLNRLENKLDCWKISTAPHTTIDKE